MYNAYHTINFRKYSRLKFVRKDENEIYWYSKQYNAKSYHWVNRCLNEWKDHKQYRSQQHQYRNRQKHLHTINNGWSYTVYICSYLSSMHYIGYMLLYMYLCLYTILQDDMNKFLRYSIWMHIVKYWLAVLEHKMDLDEFWHKIN